MRIRLPLISVVAWCGLVVPAFGQASAPRPAGRLSFFVNAAQVTGDGTRFSSTELVTSMTYGLAERGSTGLEYGVDVRYSRPADGTREARLSFYDGYVGARFANGAMRVRAGQMWLTDLGALGAIAGGMFEYQRGATTGLGRLRVGGFGGIEPNA